MGAERERVYNAVSRQPAQNLEAGYRSRWAVNTAVDAVNTAVNTAVNAAVSAAGLGRSEHRDTGSEITIDLTPSIRLARDSGWSRLLNRPRSVEAEL